MRVSEILRLTSILYNNMKQYFSILLVLLISFSLVAAPPKRTKRGRTTHTTAVKKTSPKLNVVADTVDLGLGVYWASWNSGASKPEMLGAEFAWGATTPNPESNKQNYRHYNPECYAYTKYFWYGEDENDISQHILDSKNNVLLDSVDDAAITHWGNGWRMPTYEEFKELNKKCRWEWVEDSENNIFGFKVTGPNGNHIFFPGKDIGDVNYWTSSGIWKKYNGRDEGNDDAWGLIMNHFNAFLIEHYRYASLYIRPVKEKK